MHRYLGWLHAEHFKGHVCPVQVDSRGHVNTQSLIPLKTLCQLLSKPYKNLLAELAKIAQNKSFSSGPPVTLKFLLLH